MEPAGFRGLDYDRVAPGVYKLKLGYSGNFKTDLFQVVDPVADGSRRPMTSVEIHWGNFPGDTDGCYMPTMRFHTYNNGSIMLAGGTSRNTDKSEPSSTDLAINALRTVIENGQGLQRPALEPEPTAYIDALLTIVNAILRARPYRYPYPLCCITSAASGTPHHPACNCLRRDR